MASEEILKMLIAERDKLDAAIRALQGGSGGIPSPFREKVKPAAKTAAKKAKRRVSPEARAKMAAAAKERWAKRKAAAKKSPPKA